MMGRVVVYGVDHSPWVQGVCLSLHRLGVSYELVSQPTSLEGYRSGGMIMPVVRWSEGGQTSDSFAVYERLAQRCVLRGGSGLVRRDQVELERFFIGYVFTRVSPGKHWRFLRGWAQMRSDRRAGFSTIFRAFMYLYFYLLILIGRLHASRRGRVPDDLTPWVERLDDWVGRLGSKTFFGGDEPDFLDDALFGQVQCLASGLTPEAMERLLACEPLRAWIGAMNQRYADYRHLYSSLERKPLRSSVRERLLFYSALGTMVLAAPVTMAFLADAFRRRSGRPNRSGGRLKAQV